MGEKLNSDAQNAAARQLGEIIDGALELDKKLSLQITPLEWRYNREILERTNYQFDQETMEAREDAGLSRKKRHKPRRVQVVIAPALAKRSEPTGDVLLKSIVYYT